MYRKKHSGFKKHFNTPDMYKDLQNGAHTIWGQFFSLQVMQQLLSKLNELNYINLQMVAKGHTQLMFRTDWLDFR